MTDARRMRNPTREKCGTCGVRGWGFWSPWWKEIAGDKSDECMCVQCFGLLGDERNLDWSDGLVIHPVSIVVHHDYINAGSPAEGWDIGEWVKEER